MTNEPRYSRHTGGSDAFGLRGGPTLPHRHTIAAPLTPSVPSAGSDPASDSPTFLANGSNLEYKDTRPTLQNSQFNHRKQPEAQRRRAFCVRTLPRHILASSRTPRTLATPQAGCWIHAISDFAVMRDFRHWSIA
ncbi:hypothetical protein ACJ72_06580 [Emergomyces africanus]|uniref:Uncharacterized protein n=1 Tax=Emergomyces africanus TaxID=1955775 RepID=A0A1B7NQN6_9EURO|nr:hypothetical protein ACJ72_06580 [Emergomyces africanus]